MPPNVAQDVLEEQEFYEMCQYYRHAKDNGDAGEAFESLKTFIRNLLRDQRKGEAVAVKYVGVSNKDAPEPYDSHPNDKEPRCEKLRERFKIMGDDTGQGLHPYWKWAYATGFNDAKDIFTTPQPNALVEALEALVNQLEIVHADEQYKSVWLHVANHGMPYTGPEYSAEFKNAQNALATHQSNKGN